MSGKPEGLSPNSVAEALWALETTARRETILVVDDEAAGRAPICRVLRRSGYDVLEACDGEDALRVLQDHHEPIPLVISDIIMPELLGTDLIEMLHGWYPRMRVLFISGYSPEPLEAREDLADCSFLAKPFTMDALTQRVRDLLAAD
jgi:two-component system cell cycle sensor histidine kinase/response regulator CckA